MKKIKQNKGITLIALIITIVVLLILAVVTISAVNEGNLFAHANNAATKWNTEVADENYKISKYLTEMGKHDGSGDDNVEVNDFLVNYILGPDRSGKLLYEELIDKNTGKFFDDETTTDIDESEKITVFNIDFTSDINGFFIKYNNNIYFFAITENNEDTRSASYSTNNPVPLIYAPQGREGQIVQYDSDNDGIDEEWMILTDRNGLVEIVSTVPMGELALGKIDTVAISEVTSDINGDGLLDNTDYAIYSYNNAITRINNYCKSLILSSNNVRSIGETTENGGHYTSELFESWYVGTNKNQISAKNAYPLDHIKLLYFNQEDVGTPSWIAGRYVLEINGTAAHCIVFSVYVTTGNYYGETTIWTLNSDGTIEPDDATNAVRLVIINPEGI